MANEKFKVKFGLAVGDTAATIDATTGDIVTNGDIQLGGNDIKSSGGSTAITLSGTDVAVAGDLTVTGNDIKSSSATAITLSGTDVAFAGDITVNGGDIKSNGGTTAITIVGADATVQGNATINGVLYTDDVTNLSGPISITSGANGNISITPNGTGDVVLSADTVIVGDSASPATITTNGNATLTVQTQGSNNLFLDPGSGTTLNDGHMVLGQSNTAAILTTNGTGNLDIRTGSYPTSANINLADGANGNITVDTDGTGQVIINADVDVNGTIYLDQLQVDNININGNTISSTDTNGNITLDPNGTGLVAVVGDLTATAITASKSISTGNTSLTASDFIVVTNTMGATGTVSTPVDVNGLLAGNNTSSTNSLVINRSYGQNLPSGTTATSPNSQLVIEGSRGTPASPLALATNNVVGTLSFGGYDGTRFTATEAGAGSLQLFGLASGAWTHDGTYTTNAGSTATLRNQPQDLRLTSNSRQNIFNSTWTTVASAPPTQNVVWNSPTMTTQYDTVGTTYNGHGKQAHTFFHPTISIFGVPSQDTGADNTNITGTNIVNFYANRQSGWSGRRDNVLSGDTLASINVFGQTGTNSTGVGSQAGTIAFTAAENFGVSNRGSTLTLQTGNIGTNTLATRLSLSSTGSTISTDQINILGSTVTATPYLSTIMPSTGSGNGEIMLRTASTDGSKKSSFNFGSFRFNGTDLSATQNGDVLGEYKFNGNTATSGSTPGVPGAPGANIVAAATENWTSTANGTKFTFSAIKDGTLTSVSVIDSSPTSTTFKNDTFTLQNSSGTALTSAAVNYTRTFGEFAYTNAAGFAIPAQNTIYTMPLDTTLSNSGVTIANTGDININVSGWYKIIISLQVTLTVSNQPGQVDFWLRKNGADVANSKTQIDLLKDQKSVISMDWLVNSDGNDYWEIVYVGTSANYADIDFPTIAATTTPYVSPVAPALLVNVIPAGM